MASQPRKRTRRQFIYSMARAGCVAGLSGSLLASYAKKSSGLAASSLRPPGALPEPDFLGACSRCGLCVQSCPYDTLKLASWLDDAPNGTPYFEARAVPCEMCDHIPCVEACPTGALDPALEDIDDARMGVAVIVDRESCLNLQGMRCDVCYRVCPLIDEAITLEMRPNPRQEHHALFEPVVNPDVCTGCGKCEHGCIPEDPAIKVLPVAQARGKIHDHFQLYYESDQAKEAESAGSGVES